ncbi:MAG: NAD(P)H-hydrate dehydratase [Leptonema sp. (in: bacteria)]
MEVNFVTFQQVKEIDQLTIQKSVPEKILMGLASQSIFISMYHLDLIHPKNVYIFLCGSGNNGGDGFALAYLMLSSMFLNSSNIKIYSNPPKSESSKYYQNLVKNYVPLLSLEDFINQFYINEQLLSFDKLFFIEALLGSGQKDLPAKPYMDILKKITLLKEKFSNKIQYIAIDIPAGLSEEYSYVNPKEFIDFFQFCIPDIIFNIGLPKLAISFHPKISSESKIINLPCGFDPKVQEEVVKSKTEFVELPPVSHFDFIKKKKYDHKYTSGYAWIFSGSENFEGASFLASKAFFYSGGGILHLVYFSHHKEKFLHFDPSIIYHHIKDFDDKFYSLKIPNCIAIGSGISPNDIENYKFFFIKFLKYLSEFNHKPIIILDAYATKLILEAEYPEVLKRLTILTPHLGEWKELGGEFPYIVKNWDSILDFHKKLGCSILLKGSISFFLPYPSQEKKSKVYIWNHQNQNLSTAGSGDVLVGMLLRFFSKIDDNLFSDYLLLGIQTILTLQNLMAREYGTSFEYLKQIKEILKNEVLL